MSKIALNTGFIVNLNYPVKGKKGRGILMKRIKKVFAVLLSLAMVLTLLPAMALADTEDSGTENNSNVVVSKTATLEDDGTYTIELSAYATGTTTTVTEKSGVPLDIVLVLDQSGSMANSNYVTPLKNAVTNFVKAISDNGKEYQVDHRIALVGYASRYDSSSKWTNTGLFINGALYNYQTEGSTTETTRLTSKDYQDALVSVNDGDGNVNSSITSAISVLNGKGATYTNYGMEMANGIFENNPIPDDSNRKRIVVVFTDGEPGSTGYDSTIANLALKESYETKNTYGATVYTVGLYSNANDNVTTFMNFLSSNYPTAKTVQTSGYVYTAVYSSELDPTQTYYVRRYNNSDYTAVKYSDGQWKASNSSGQGGGYSQTYTPKTSATDTSYNSYQFYARITASEPAQAASKYYMTTANSGELNAIFQNITNDIQNPTTSVTLDAESVMRDVIADGFKLPENDDTSANVTIKTVAGSTTDGQNITWGTETTSSAGITASVNGQNIDITGFNYSEKYIAPSHDGEKLIVTIKGVEATDAAITNEEVDTNAATSGIYAKDAEEPAVTFPQPSTILTSKSYVLDYAKEVTLNSSDWKQSSLKKISGDMAKNAASVSAQYGTVTRSGDSVKYQPTTTKWDGYDSFYAFGTTTDVTIKAASANANGNLWSKISVIPANNVYYEDDFVTDKSTGTVGIEYTGNWTIDGTAESNTTSDPVSTEGVDSVHGWEDALADDAAYSDGSAHKLETGATATFTFTGTGVDIYSRTDMTTGTVTANLYTGEEAKKANIKKALIVDNKSVTGEQYYQIPTLAFENLDYGTYTVKITVTNQAENRTTYYLDGIRVYNPVKEDATVSEAYGQNEINAVFTQARTLLTSGSAAFIDEGNDETGESTGTSAAGDYTVSEVGKIAPENEIYLSKNQSIVLRTNGNSSNTYYLGLKAPQGATIAEITNGAGKSEVNIGHATDLYYEITPDNEGNIVVKNVGDNLLSITKLRTAGSGESGVAALSADEAVDVARTFMTANYVSYMAVAASDEELTEQDTPVVTEPEETIAEEPGEVIIENPQESEAEQEQPISVNNSWIRNLFSSFKGLFVRR